MVSPEILTDVIRHFFEPDDLPEVQSIGAGNINDTYRVEFQQNAKRQVWLLQRLNHLVFTDPEAVMHNIRIVAEHLSKQPGFSLRILKPVPGIDGQFLQRDEAGNYWRVFPFFENTYAPEKLPDPAVAHEAASAYGIFLRALRDCPVNQIRETIPGFHDTDQRWTVFQNIIENAAPERIAKAEEEIAGLQRAKVVFDEISNLKSSGALPSRVVHNDTKAGNVLIDHSIGKAVSVIDWDTIMPGTVLSDFGDMVRTFVPDRYEDDRILPRVRMDVLEALREGFLEQTADFLLETEHQHLMLGARWIAGEQALRFLSDYLNGDLYYKTAYPDHNLVRTRNQLGLFHALEEI